MTQQIFKFLKEYSTDINSINRLIVSAYIKINTIDVTNNILLKSLMIEESNQDEYKALLSFIDKLTRHTDRLVVEDVIRLFEFVISPSEKEVNGAVYTPTYIREYITDNVLRRFTQDQLSDLIIADISCGCGGFFITIIDRIRQRIDVSLDILYRNIYGVDVADYSIERTKILLCLYAITEGVDIEQFDYNLYVANSLDFNLRDIDQVALNGGFDIIVGNPPYVSSVKISNESKTLLDNWDVCKTGKPDLYIPFFQVAIELLNANGVLGYITVSNFYRSLNGRAFRKYMSQFGFEFSIIDFGSEQVFKGRSTYTCICTISRNVGPIYYVKTNSLNIVNLSDSDFTVINYNDLSDNNGWLLQTNDIAHNITVIESTGIPLSQYCNIKNGFATLKNDIYILDVKESDETYYYINADDKIEKSICRDAVKPNTLKHEDELEAKIEHLLFPYHVSDGTLNIIPENELAQNFPCAYKYLLSKKEILSTRDKGQREYAAWYSFGRSQALMIKGYKLLFPYISDKPYFVISEDQDLLFYNGYALVSDDPIRIDIARKILRSKIFWYYIKHTSKPYGSNYFALAKNYIKNFGIPYFTDADTATLLALTDEQEINDFLLDKYEINHI